MVPYIYSLILFSLSLWEVEVEAFCAVADGSATRRDVHDLLDKLHARDVAKAQLRHLHRLAWQASGPSS